MGMFDNIVFDEFTLLDEGVKDNVVKFGTKLKAVAKNEINNAKDKVNKMRGKPVKERKDYVEE